MLVKHKVLTWNNEWKRRQKTPAEVGSRVIGKVCCKEWLALPRSAERSRDHYKEAERDELLEMKVTWSKDLENGGHYRNLRLCWVGTCWQEPGWHKGFRRRWKHKQLVQFDFISFTRTLVERERQRESKVKIYQKGGRTMTNLEVRPKKTRKRYYQPGLLCTIGRNTISWLWWL